MGVKNGPVGRNGLSSLFVCFNERDAPEGPVDKDGQAEGEALAAPRTEPKLVWKQKSCGKFLPSCPGK